MDKEHTVREKSYDFALRIIKLCLWLKEKQHYEISAQLLRSVTSIGANIEEGIASKEARETHYWLRLLRDSDILSDTQTSELINESEELIKMLTSIVKTGKSNLKQLKTNN